MNCDCRGICSRLKRHLKLIVFGEGGMVVDFVVPESMLQHLDGQICVKMEVCVSDTLMNNTIDYNACRHQEEIVSTAITLEVEVDSGVKMRN